MTPSGIWLHCYNWTVAKWQFGEICSPVFFLSSCMFLNENWIYLFKPKNRKIYFNKIYDGYRILHLTSSRIWLHRYNPTIVENYNMAFWPFLRHGPSSQFWHSAISSQWLCLTNQWENIDFTVHGNAFKYSSHITVSAIYHLVVLFRFTICSSLYLHLHYILNK